MVATLWLWNHLPKWISWLPIAIMWIWQLPQCLCGAVVKLFYCTSGSKKVQTIKRGICITQNWGMTSGVSLGEFQFTYRYSSQYTNSHEAAHNIQSIMLGPLYLLVVGLPSIIWCWLYSYTSMINHRKYSYYWFYTERWADRLAGIPDR